MSQFVLGFLLGLVTGALASLVYCSIQRKRHQARPDRQVSPTVPRRRSPSTHSHGHVIARDPQPTVRPQHSKRKRNLGFGSIAVLALSALAKWILGHSPASTTPPSVNPPTVVVQQSTTISFTDRLRMYLDSVNVVDKPDYVVKRHFRQNLVEGQCGDWYTIDIRTADRKRSLLFDSGKWQQRESEARFKEVIEQIRSDLRLSKATFALYVRGNADLAGDRLTYIDSIRSGESRWANFLPPTQRDSNIYQNHFTRVQIPSAFANRDLPNLRGMYFSHRLADAGIQNAVLDGTVSDVIDKKDRNVEIFLFLPCGGSKFIVDPTTMRRPIRQ
ncbi:MAG: hypothetical protein JWM27_1052 [Gemmatimonadetes bacterium]|nr:hypothetical protein [Gemmatimonadota bacterium]